MVEHTESFAERKARYDEERRKRKEAEAEAKAEAEAVAPAESEPRTDVPKKEAAPVEDAVSVPEANSDDGEVSA